MEVLANIASLSRIKTSLPRFVKKNLELKVIKNKITLNIALKSSVGMISMLLEENALQFSRHHPLFVDEAKAGTFAAEKQPFVVGVIRWENQRMSVATGEIFEHLSHLLFEVSAQL